MLAESAGGYLIEEVEAALVPHPGAAPAAGPTIPQLWPAHADPFPLLWENKKMTFLSVMFCEFVILPVYAWGVGCKLM